MHIYEQNEKYIYMHYVSRIPLIIDFIIIDIIIEIFYYNLFILIKYIDNKDRNRDEIIHILCIRW
jgi:hypothetical protein